VDHGLNIEGHQRVPKDFDEQPLSLIAYSETRAGKNLRFKKHLGFLGFNVRAVARGALYTGIRSRRRSIH